MKRYALFAARCFYAGGGWNDFVGTYDNAHLALTTGARIERDAATMRDGWWHVVDLATGRIVHQSEEVPHNHDDPLPAVEDERERLNT